MPVVGCLGQVGSPFFDVIGSADTRTHWGKFIRGMLVGGEFREPGSRVMGYMDPSDPGVFYLKVGDKRGVKLHIGKDVEVIS